ncbi:MAG: tetratricopeptide repeat protein [FCB group bacterium]|nr:tetratricopeptide repeat protein [FCB group bacterium]
MLKPRKKITKKEIKKDPLLETIYNIETKLRDNRRTYLRIAVGIIVLLIVIITLNNRRLKAIEESETLLGEALVSLEIGDVDNARYQLEELIDEYGSTESGTRGYYFWGKFNYEQQDYEAAENALSTFVAESSDKLLLPAAHRMLAEIYRQEGNDAKAEEHLRKAIETSEIRSVKQNNQLDLAAYLMEKNETDEALSIVDEVLASDELETTIRQNAEKLLGRLKG